MIIKSKFGILLLGVSILISCQFEESYTYEEIKAEVAPYLHAQMFNDFRQSDTLVIYDTSYFNKMVSILNNYQDKLVVEDSAHNRLIVERLSLVKVEKIQTRRPDIYLPFQVLEEYLDTGSTEKIIAWLSNVPKQFEAAKVQLKQPNIEHTKLAIEELKKAYLFVSNDLTIHLESIDQSEEYTSLIVGTKFAIKDYLAFLNSKIINGEVN